MFADRLIDKLIEQKGARPRYTGFDWSHDTDKLIPRGDAQRDRLLAERYAPRDPACLTRI